MDRAMISKRRDVNVFKSFRNVIRQSIDNNDASFFINMTLDAASALTRPLRTVTMERLKRNWCEKIIVSSAIVDGNLADAFSTFFHNLNLKEHLFTFTRFDLVTDEMTLAIVQRENGLKVFHHARIAKGDGFESLKKFPIVDDFCPDILALYQEKLDRGEEDIILAPDLLLFFNHHLYRKFEHGFGENVYFILSSHVTKTF